MNSKLNLHNNITTSKSAKTVKYKNAFLSKPSNGFTLIEILLYIAIVPFILASAVGLFYFVTQSQIKNQVINEVNQQGEIIIDNINKSIQSSSAINSPTQGNVGPNLSLQNINPTLNPTIYNVSSNTLYLTQGTNLPQQMHNNKIQINNLEFANLSQPNTTGNISYTFTLNYINSSNKQSYNYSKTFYGGSSLRP